MQMAMLVSLDPEELIPADHPIRRIRPIVDAMLADLDDTFEAMYEPTGRRSVPPETLLKSTILMGLYSIRSERAFCERLNYDLLFKWFLDMPIDARAFDPTTFTKNRERLLEADVAAEFLAAAVRQAKLRRYISSEHFSVDGTLLKAWASHKSFQPKARPDDDNDGDGGGSDQTATGRNVEVSWRGGKRSNDTHESKTDPDARLYRKSSNVAAILGFMGHVLMEHRNGLIVDAKLTHADGYAERTAALSMLDRLPKTKRRRTLAADKAYDTADFVADLRDRGFTPHVAQNTSGRRSRIDGRTTRHGGYKISQRIRARIEEPFGWIKTIGGGNQLRYKGIDRNQAWFQMNAGIYNVLRIAALDTTA